jgi:hypothetical protein
MVSSEQQSFDALLFCQYAVAQGFDPNVRNAAENRRSPNTRSL